MYDVDGNGHIDLIEMTKIVKSIYNMMGPNQVTLAGADKAHVVVDDDDDDDDAVVVAFVVVVVVAAAATTAATASYGNKTFSTACFSRVWHNILQTPTIPRICI